MDYDVGLVRLAQPLAFGINIQPIKLARQTYTVRDGRLLEVAGWGYVMANGPISETLRYAKIPVVNQASCKRIMGNLITDRMLCAGYLAGGVDACQMDSGGPLVAYNRLVGIVSWGIGCALPNRPGIYTRITAVLPWITETMATQYNDELSETVFSYF